MNGFLTNRILAAIAVAAAFNACGDTASGTRSEQTSSESSGASSSRIASSSAPQNSSRSENSRSLSASDTSQSASSISWAPPAGSATVAYSTDEPFLKILENLDAEAIATVSQGRELFIAEWSAAPDSRTTLDGLGPLFNANACLACHVADGRVPPFNDDATLDDSFLFRVGNAGGDVHPLFGDQLQTNATSGLFEAEITWLQNDANGTLLFRADPDISAEGFSLGPRIAPHLPGMGLLDLVSEATILEYADPDDANGDGISGRAHWIIEESEKRIGRFGWKAINSTLRTQNAGAMHQDMGLTTPVNPRENCTDQQTICRDEPSGGTPEVSKASLTAIVNFMTALGVPDRRIENQETFDKGAVLFEETGCAACHRPTMRTGVSDRFSALSDQTIYPYTDLLLHDMGERLGDGVMEKNATSTEWRTPPLWGIGIVALKEGARFLHDGRAKTLREAIEHHDGEAKKARETFNELDEEHKQNLLEFLGGI